MSLVRSNALSHALCSCVHARTGTRVLPFSVCDTEQVDSSGNACDVYL